MLNKWRSKHKKNCNALPHASKANEYAPAYNADIAATHESDYLWSTMAHTIKIIGIDPGLRRSGWGIIESDGVRLSYVASGFVKSTPDEQLAYRLREIFEGLGSVLSSYSPREAAIEETFVNKNARATLKLGQARGMALLAPALNGLYVAEYSPNLVKKSVVGVGHAEKRQIQMMVKMLLPKAKFENADEADALAIAICHAHQRPRLYIQTAHNI